ncbi:MAG: HesA/MoeB/ThiF family protein [Ignavibacteriae bacterium]|nr:HesA/MoeB/ThiF family protein [Ignavibacteriota bacterium]
MALSPEEYSRYSRHLLLNEVGESGQLFLKNSKVLVVGAGGLGCPALLYLTAAGVGTIGIIDGDAVQESNLQRQIIYTTSDIGKLKATISACKLKKQNSNINFEVYDYPLTTANAHNIIPKYDIIIDGTDNFTARYLINDACVLWNKPFVHGSLLKFRGQVAVFNYSKDNFTSKSATYRCIFPTPPLQGSVQNCSEIGVLGVLPGIIGTLQAAEAIKIILGIGEPLFDSLLLCNALNMTFDKISIERNEANWGDMPRTKEEFLRMDYNFFCGEQHGNIQEITVEELFALLNTQKIELIDIRNEEETPSLISFLPLHYKLKNIPLIQLYSSLESINRSTKTIIICQSGNRSLTAVHKLQNEYGYSNLYSLKGGILALIQQNLSSV